MSGVLAGQVALVTGASRGLGRAAALEFAAAGAFVIATARSTRARPTLPDLSHLTVESTLDAIRGAGGRGQATPCDHTDPVAVEALMRDVLVQHGKLDILVNNAWGGHDQVDAPRGPAVWDEPLPQLRSMLLSGAYSDYVTSLLALRSFMSSAGRGVILSTTYHTDDPPGWLPYEVSKAAKNRLTFALGEKLRGSGVTCVAVSPGWMRTELMEQQHVPGELDSRTETPHYAARALVALAADPDVGRHTGRVLDVGEVARLYGVTDLDGTQPQWHEAHLERMRQDQS